MPEQTDIGSSLRKIRKRRGLTQRELAEASGVSVSLIRKLEQGEITDTRMETARKLAVALRITTASLLTRDHDDENPVPEQWQPLRDAVERPPLQSAEAPTTEGTAALMPAVRAAYFDNRLAELVPVLAPLLHDLDALGDDDDARALRSHALQIAGSVLTQTHQYGAAETALSRALDSATDRLRTASIITTWTWLLMRQGRLEDARRLATRWADELEPRVSRATVEDLAAWGWVLLQLSAAAVRDNRDGEARDAMRLARSAAVLTGRELPRGNARLATWGPLTVAYKQAERNVILDRPDLVLEAAERLGPSGPEESTEHHRHRLDVARAHVMMRQYGEAVEVLDGVRERAPEWLAQQRYARDILGDVVERRRTLTPEMRTLADAVSLPL
ncbi:helix-turn-helix transcriptional regulator [Streptomyces hygroscopicus]|uniref:helix-turn-helix domain-containing protein n=1 Tax=Streptomyces hygroscopicus TaxID=1912 RepID=UPI0033C7A7F7